MNPAVSFALGVLAVVFTLSFILLVALCWRRRQQKKAFARAENSFKLARNDKKKVDKLIELHPLLSNKMDDALQEEYEVPFSDVVGVLRRTADIVKILADVGVSRASSKIYEVIAQAMFRVDTHFHELIEFVPQEEKDIRVLEARALSLTTSVWTLMAAFTLHGFDKTKEEEAQNHLDTMYKHIDSLREHCPQYPTRTEGTPQEREGSQSTDDTNVVDTPAENPLDELAPPDGAAPAAPGREVPIIEIDAPVDVHEEPMDDDALAAAGADLQQSLDELFADDAAAAPATDAVPAAAAESNGSPPTEEENGPAHTANGSPQGSKDSTTGSPAKPMPEVEEEVKEEEDKEKKKKEEKDEEKPLLTFDN